MGVISSVLSVLGLNVASTGRDVGFHYNLDQSGDYPLLLNNYGSGYKNVKTKTHMLKIVKC